MNTNLLFGIHCHQPVENFYHVVDEAVHKCYRPFFEVVRGFESFKFSIHYSGWLLEYIRIHHRDLFELIGRLAEKGQIEFFSGGFYEPVLSAITLEDRRGQINKLSNYIHNYFGMTPKGLWLTERVWDPSIIPALADCGIEYVIVDDYHFMSSGISKDNLYGYYLTEQDGIPMKLFPIDKTLRYIVPFKPVGEILDHIHGISSKPGQSAVIFDDGEKFGVWPGTHDWVYKDKWFRNFLMGVGNDAKINACHFSDVSDNEKPLGIAYLPITSYMEMGEWALPPDSFENMEDLLNHLGSEGFSDKFLYLVKGGIWKNFFSKYSESNYLHKRLMYLSYKINKIATVNGDNTKMLDDLYKAECNDVFWHGIFGGLYLSNLRNNAYRFLIEAEKKYETAEGMVFPSIEVNDINLDAYDEVFIRNNMYNACFTTKYGGQLIEFDIKPLNFNLLNTLTRRKEGYHRQISKSEGDLTSQGRDGISTIHDMSVSLSDEAKSHLIYDWYDRSSFIDHIVPYFYIKEFSEMSFQEYGDFVNKPVSTKILDHCVEFSRNGGIYVDGTKYDTNLTKIIIPQDNGIEMDIAIDTSFVNELTYVLECNLHFYNLEALKINTIDVNSKNELFSNNFLLNDASLNTTINISFNKNALLSWYLVKTVSQSEKGLDLSAQGICLLFSFKFRGKISVKATLKTI